MYARFAPFFAFIALAGCGSSDDSDTFLPLDQVCSAYAEEVCGAQDGCCDMPADADCESRVHEACELQRDRLTMEAKLHYESEHADRQRAALHAALHDCAAPAPVATFFSGGAKQGAACQNDAQCTSFQCVDNKCGPAEAQPLCDY